MAKLDKLITYAYLREEVDIPQSIEDEELEHKIYRAQEMLRMIIGDTFYQDFKTNYINKTLSDPYNTLYPYIKQFIAWQTHEYWIVKANFKPTRTGFRVHREDNSDAASDTQMAMLIKDSKQTSQYYKKVLVEFLEENSSSYPLYSSNCGNDVVGNSFHISVVSRKKHRHGCNCPRCRC